MYITYDEFLIYSKINEYNTEGQIPDSVKNVANNIADKISQKNSEIVNNIKTQYNDKSFKQITIEIFNLIKNSGVGEFAGEVGVGLVEKLKNVIRFLAKKVGEYSVIGMLLVSILDYIIPFGMLDNFFNKLQLNIGITIVISLIVYILARKKKK